MIVTFDHPALSTVAEPVTAHDSPAVRTVIDTMRRELAKHPTGVGLAAPQVGVSMRIILVQSEVRGCKPFAMLNPIIRRRSEATQFMSEGCLSYPGVLASIERRKYVEVEWTREDGREMYDRFTGLQARIIQHEIDHLDGICIWRKAY